jgi:hypothetical protein
MTALEDKRCVESENASEAEEGTRKTMTSLEVKN